MVYAPPMEKTYIEITEPATRSVTFLPSIVVKGRVVNPVDVKAVRVNDMDANVFDDYSFVSVVKFPRYALNMINVQAISATGRIIDTLCLKVARLVPFKDVPEEDPDQDLPRSAQDLEAVYDIPVQVSAVLGQATMQVSQLLKLGRSAVVELDRKVGEAIDIYVNNRLVARGEVVVVDERLGVTMTEIIKDGDA